MPCALTLPTAQCVSIRKIPLGPAEAIFTRREDGAILIRSPHSLAAYPDKFTWHLAHWAAVAPERTFSPSDAHGTGAR